MPHNPFYAGNVAVFVPSDPPLGPARALLVVDLSADRGKQVQNTKLQASSALEGVAPGPGRAQTPQH